MKPLRYWSISIASDLVLVGLFYSYAVRGVAQAFDLIQFWMWVFAAMRLAASFLFEPGTLSKIKRPPGFNVYNWLTDILIISALVWFGCIALPVFYLVAGVLFDGAKTLKPEDQREAFEAWIKSEPFFAMWDQQKLERDDIDGGYIDANAHAAWLVWKRGAK